MLYLIVNGPGPTTAVVPPVTTGTALKTMVQVKPKATVQMRIKEWGISFDGSAAATPGKVELIEVDVAATVTAFVAADIHKYDESALLAGDPTTAYFEVGTAASGFTASAEGTITAARLMDGPQLVAPTTQFSKQLPLGVGSVIQAGKFARIRVQFGTAINTLCWMLVEV